MRREWEWLGAGLPRVSVQGGFLQEERRMRCPAVRRGRSSLQR